MEVVDNWRLVAEESNFEAEVFVGSIVAVVVVDTSVGVEVENIDYTVAVHVSVVVGVVVTYFDDSNPNPE